MKPARAADQILAPKSSREASTMISGMRKDNVFMAIRNDNVVCELARKLLVRAGHSDHHVSYARARLRKLGQLLLQVRRSNANHGDI